MSSSADNIAVYNCFNSTSPCLLGGAPLFAPSINKPTQMEDINACAALRKPVPSSECLPFLSARRPPPSLNGALSLALSVFLQHLSAPLFPPEEEQAHAGMLPRPFQWPSPNGAGAFVPRAFLNRFWGNQQGGIRLPIEGGVALARCLLGVIMDHTWSCSSSSPRPGPWVRGHRPSSPSNRPMKRSSSQPFCLGPLSLSPSLPWPFVLLSGGPVPQHPLPQLCSRHLQYATNKYSRNAMNAGLSVSVNVPK